MIVRIDSKDLEDLIGRAYGKMSVRDMGAGDFELLARIRRTGLTGVHSKEETDPGETREFDAVEASDAITGVEGDAAYERERERITGHPEPWVQGREEEEARKRLPRPPILPGHRPPPPTPGGERIAQPPSQASLEANDDD